MTSSDLTLCTGTSGPVICPMRDTCRRFAATAGQRQSWFSETPLYRLDTQGEWKCDEYWREDDAR